MECNESQPFVSALYDGEHIPADAADHINGCAECRRQLQEYAAMGAELKLAASRAEEILSGPEWLRSSSPCPRLLNARALTARVMVPRFALGLGIIAILALSVGLTLVRAQTRAKWFQFQLYPAEMPGQLPPRVAKAGYREPRCWHWGVISATQNVCAMVSVTAIKRGEVQLAIKARRYHEPDNWKVEHNMGGLYPAYPETNQVEKDMGNLPGTNYIYVPGQTLEIPIEGGGELVLKGQVSDEQPKLAWGLPLNPRPDELVLNHTTFIRDKTVLLPPGGTSGIISTDHAFFMNFPGAGFFTLALQPFEGAVQGEAEWGEIHFTIDGHKYFLLSESPITGGDQPHTIWVSREAFHGSINTPAYIRGGKLPGTQH